MKEPLTVEEVAALARVSAKTIYRWVRQGKLSPVRLGKRLLFSRDAVAALLPPSAA